MSALSNARFTKTLLTATALFSLALPNIAVAGLGFAPGPAGANYYSYQNLLIGATTAQQAVANYGKGVTVGTLDTGVTSSWVGFSGLSVSSYQCLNNSCSSAIANSDNNGHGTFVASEIIGGAAFSNGNGMLGVAPLANLVSVKVLDANGSGSSNDVANGIRYATDRGAKVLNLSLGPGGTAAQQAAFYNSLAASVNYAASKGVVVVFAGGNAAQLFAGGSTIGTSNKQQASSNLFTDAALTHMMFVGATNSNKQLTSYSNTPGTAGFYSSTGKFYSYSSMWLMADGGGVANGQCADCIVGAPNVSNANYLSLMAGTSMAAPQAVGAAALLAARWPILMTQGNLTALLETTATNIGSSNLYGDGFINLNKAFQPVGGIYALNANGTKLNVSQTPSTVLSLGPLGTTNLSKAISYGSVFDSYNRDFSGYLSGTVVTSLSESPAAASVTAPKTTGVATKFADGSSLAFGSSVDNNPLIDHPSKANSNNWYMSFTDNTGSTMAAGKGFPASASFAGALWGGNESVSNEIAALGASNTLLNLAQGGNFVAFGSKLSNSTRVGFSWTETANSDNPGVDLLKPNAASFSTGITTVLGENWKGGVTLGLLDEKNGLLGTTYTSGPVNFGDNNQSMSLGVTSAYALSDKCDFVVDAAIVRTSGVQPSASLISDVSTLYARTLGAALVQREAITKGDNLTFSVRSPLRVISGSASVTTNSVDADGNPIINSQRVGLTPDGTEVDFAVGYAVPMDDNMSWNVSMDVRRDVGNIRGSNDADALAGFKLTF